MWPFRSKPNRASFPIARYKLDAPISELDGLVEFTANEYAEVGGRVFEGERNFNAGDVEFRGQRWAVKLQAVEGRICKITLDAVFNSTHDANPIALAMLGYCKEKLGKPTEQRTGQFIWDTVDGNVILLTTP